MGFHGGSGSEKDKIQIALQNGVVKMNIDTDTQWAYWNGVRKFESKNRAFMQGQIGNPKGADEPDKKFYDPRAWVRKGEESFKERLHEPQLQGCSWWQGQAVIGFSNAPVDFGWFGLNGADRWPSVAHVVVHRGRSQL